MRKSLYMLICVLCCSIYTITAGEPTPFGFRMGMPLSELKVIKVLEEGSLYSVEIINKHGDFEDYVIAVVTKQHGLSKLRFHGTDITTSVYGSELKNKFVALKNQIDKIYPVGKLHDFLRHGSIWDEAKDFMMGLHRKERILSAFWTKDDNVKLPKNINAISLTVRVPSTSKGYFILEYEFANWPKVQVELEKAKASSF